MSTVRELHDKAMELAQLALVARQRGDIIRAEALAREAFGYESDAADLVEVGRSSEPTRAILYSSAASLAYQSREFDAALQLVARGLSGYPPPEVKGELKALWEQVNFEEHLQVRGVVLSSEDLQVSLKGNVVGSGIVTYGEFLKRIEAMYSILSRTVQRKMKRKYQRTGRVGGMYKYFTPALSVPRTGSFAITFRLGLPQEYQTTILAEPAQIIDDVLSGADYINRGEERQLRGLIQEDSYYLNFVSLVRKIAPDGENIDLVGLTSNRRTVGLTRCHREITILQDVVPKRADTKPVELRGLLDYAKSRRENVVGITTEEYGVKKVHVREGMDDLVRSYFGQQVTVTGADDGQRIYLVDIQPAE